ncbi:NUDIX hydrolase [Paracoccus aminophilus]|uniref:NUDIX hydrolase n=1 Tax=Paracoccus aminophilus JCM 7686 TaxID=1367847 RepID=S5YCL6_PARAH|nr:NUDIX hydrolase [Paracoccus aminophilus]AGT09183.1 NUDIX hydrolase [Paracoccus aminophilus JCM 7686]
MNETAAAQAPIRDAATVVVLDRTAPGGPSVLMGQRGKAAAFMPSKYVFPGGAVDAGDSNAALEGAISEASARRLALEPRDGSSVTAHALAAAALRELAEETGLMIGKSGAAPADWERYIEAGLGPDPSGLIFFFRAITPPMRPRRFDARFLLLDAEAIHGDRRDFSQACDELSHLHWVPITQARRLDLPFITEVVLAEVGALVAEAGDGALAEPASVPFFDNRSAVPRFMRIA